MLSGTGGRDELFQHGIKTTKHLPGIGKSMKDHAAIFLTALTGSATIRDIAYRYVSIQYRNRKVSIRSIDSKREIVHTPP